MKGGCPCGKVRFETSGEPITAGYCHCTRCQKRTGTAVSASVRFAPGGVRITQGEDLVASWNAGEGWDKLFCPECGAHLFSRDPESGMMGVRFAAFDEDPGVRPRYRQYVAYAAPWEPIPEDGLPRYDERLPA